MIDSILNSTTIPLLQKMAAFGERRQEVLAGNFANIDTPGYRMRDLPVAAFQQALQDAVASRRERVSAGARSATRDAAAKPVGELFPDELFVAQQALSQNVTFLDANNRSIEYQVNEMTKNTMMQHFAVELLIAQMNMLQAVIGERP